MATTTTNYGFNIAEGTDTVNLLTQCYPNFTSLDSILYPIEQSGTTSATATKVGTVHQIVRVNSNCAMLRFVATANYASGDTFTVDGASVTATSVSGEALPAGAFVINQSVLAILNGSVLTVFAGGSSSEIEAADVDYDNTLSGLTATDVQAAIDEVYSDIPTIPASYAASAITYDNTVTGMTATDVQAAIDELFALIGSQKPNPVTGTFYHTTANSFLTHDGVTYNNVGGVITIPDILTCTYVSSDRWTISSNYNGTATLTPGSTYTVVAGTPVTVQGSNPSASVLIVFE